MTQISQKMTMNAYAGTRIRFLESVLKLKISL